MALPNYGRSKRGMPILDHRAAATNPWQVAPPIDALPGDEVPYDASAPSVAERARTAFANTRSGVLGVAVGDAAVPVGFSVPFGVDDSGRPLVGLRTAVLAELDLRPEQPVSFTVAETPLTAGASGGPGGVSILGTMEAVPRHELEAAWSDYTRAQPGDAPALRRGLGRLLRIRPARIVVTDTVDGVMAVDLDAYSRSSADPLAGVAPGLVTHLSNDHDGTLVLLARAFGNQPSARAAQLVAIDQYGMDLQVATGTGRQAVRLSFTKPVASSEEVRREITMMARGARFKLGIG